MGISIGSMREQITIQTIGSTRDTGGGISSNYSDSQTVQASVKPVNGKEVFAQGKLQDRVTHEIMIRHNSSVTAKDRIKFGSRFFNIRSVINVDERSRYMKILAEEGVAS
tara:strand:+ start:502 stop:831 length:330 start_codon:yes stop_codon:yes gene_type:complete